MRREWERLREEPGSIPAGGFQEHRNKGTGRAAVSDGGTEALTEGVHKEKEAPQKDDMNHIGQASLSRGWVAQLA